MAVVQHLLIPAAYCASILHPANTADSSCCCGAEGIRLAHLDGVDWVFHVDTDELMYPAGAAEFSLQVGPRPSLVSRLVQDWHTELAARCRHNHHSHSKRARLDKQASRPWWQA